MAKTLAAVEAEREQKAWLESRASIASAGPAVAIGVSEHKPIRLSTLFPPMVETEWVSKAEYNSLVEVVTELVKQLQSLQYDMELMQHDKADSLRQSS